jgi:hypothetical protein
VALKSLLTAFLGLGLAAGLLSAPATSSAQVAVSLTIAPPPLPVYEQPPLPTYGWIWTPGYWAWGPDGYFWVPGTWVEPPEEGLVWTPGYWGWSDGFFAWNAGYWGPVIGFYGGVNYGFGYPGHGYEGGYWRGRDFYYNASVTNVTSVHVTNVYNKVVENDVTINRVSYVGGPGGLAARPTAQEEQAARERHIAPTPIQTEHRQMAASRHDLLASVNNGKPPIAATTRPSEFSTHVVTATSAGGPLHQIPVHAQNLPKPAALSSPVASAPSDERAKAEQMAQLQARQEQERQGLTQQQAREHAAYAQQASRNQQAFADLERQHQQQTQQLAQRHAQELQTHTPKAPSPHPAAPHEERH